jgi:hypothetical protein
MRESTAFQLSPKTNNFGHSDVVAAFPDEPDTALPEDGRIPQTPGVGFKHPTFPRYADCEIIPTRPMHCLYAAYILQRA